LSLGTWADKILQQDANFDMNRETTTKRRATEKDAIEKYTMSTNPIKWEKEKENETDDNNGVDDSQSKDKEDNYDCDDSKRIELLKNIAEAMDIAKRSYDKTNKKQRSKRVTTGL
jgi:hypothetical protein